MLQGTWVPHGMAWNACNVVPSLDFRVAIAKSAQHHDADSEEMKTAEKMEKCAKAEAKRVLRGEEVEDEVSNEAKKLFREHVGSDFGANRKQ